ncbi:hypothetical protein M0657_012233 [Pyricularia oryzae]|nr:hypothetical protein M0657_012233 [Pyricularia oryzae]
MDEAGVVEGQGSNGLVLGSRGLENPGKCEKYQITTRLLFSVNRKRFHAAIIVFENPKRLGFQRPRTGNGLSTN